MSPIVRNDTDFGSGTTGATDPIQPGAPSFSAHGSGSITIALDENGNGDTVEYAIYVTADGVDAGYLATDGSDNGATEAWQTAGDWGTPQAIGLTDFVAYRFKVKARNELGIESVFGDLSPIMSTLPDIDYGVTSEMLEREVTSGDTRVYGTPTVTGNYATADQDSFYGDITVTYMLQNNYEDDSDILVEFSEDYNPETGSGTWTAATQGTGGDGITGLETSIAGTEHTYVWDSYADAGESELDLSVYLRITPYDADSDAGEAVPTDAFGVNNRPAAICWENMQDDTSAGVSWDKDSTPSFAAIMPDLRGGDKGFPAIRIYKEADGSVLELEKKSVEDITGWSYETAPDTWVDMTVLGIPGTIADGVNRIRYQVQTADALTVGEKYVNGEMGEVRDRG